MKKKDTKIDWLKKHQDAEHEIYSISCSIQHLANAFYVTGNTYLGDKLTHYSAKLELAGKDLTDSMGESISESLHIAQDNSVNVLKSCLAGIALSKGKRS